MDTLVFLIVVLALGSANPIGPKTIFGPSRDDRIKTAIDNNVQWLLSGIRNGSFEGPDLPRAVVALFLAKPEFFSPVHKIGQELREKIETALTELIGQRQIQADETPQLLIYRRNTAPSFIPSEELGLYLQAVLVSCVDPFDFRGYNLPHELYLSVLRYHCERNNCTFPSSAMLALCNARATAVEDSQLFMSATVFFYKGPSPSRYLTDEEAFITMTFGCLESTNHPYLRYVDPKKIKLQKPLKSYEYRHYPSNMTVEDLLMMMKPDPMENITSVSAIAAAMQNLMYNHRLKVSDLPSAVDFLLNNQDEDGSWGQSTLNSFFVLPVLSNKSFLNITSDHCPEGSGNKTLVAATGGVAITVFNGDSLLFRWSYSFSTDTSLYGALISFRDKYEIYHNGTDGKPYLHSIKIKHNIQKENNPETGYFWFTYEQTKWPKESFTLLTQSHADIQLKRSSNYLLWYRKKSEVETQNDQNEI